MQKLTIKYMAAFLLLVGTLNLQGCRAMLPGCDIAQWWDGECSNSYQEMVRKERAEYDSYTPEYKEMLHRNAEICDALANSPEHRINCKVTDKDYKECIKTYRLGWTTNVNYYHRCMRDRGTPVHREGDLID